MEQGLYWKTDSLSSGQNIPRSLRNPKTDYRVHKSITGRYSELFESSRQFYTSI